MSTKGRSERKDNNNSDLKQGLVTESNKAIKTPKKAMPSPKKPALEPLEINDDFAKLHNSALGNY